MYKCPNCGGELEFKPEDQIIRCQYCGSEFKPEELNAKAKAKSAETNKMLEGTVYTCSQCGGQLLCNDDTGVTFCSYCGSQALVAEKMEAEAPDYIIPFKVTKKQCEKIYREKIAKAWFLPTEFKQDATIEKFRGIYMPYWVMSGKGSYSKALSTEKNHLRTENGVQYDITDHYDLNIDARSFYDGIIFDSSSSLPDDVADNISPFRMKEAKNYDPACMTGFYADTGDVPADVYSLKAEKMIKKWVAEAICDDKEAEKYGTCEADIDTADVDVELSKSKKGFFPVWFLSVKNASGKMSYAVVNGVTGKIHMDLPVDYKKYLLISLCAAVPAFLILLLFTMIPDTLLIITMFLLAIAGVLSIRGAQNLYIRKNGLNDWGKRYADNLGTPELKQAKAARKKRKTSAVLITVLSVVAFFVIMVVSAVSGIDFLMMIIPLFFIVLIIFIIVKAAFDGSDKSGSGFEYRIPASITLTALLPAFIGLIIAGAVLIIDPANDLFYYCAVILCIIILCVMVLLQVNAVNSLSLRKPAQLGKRGGDEVE